MPGIVLGHRAACVGRMLTIIRVHPSTFIELVWQHAQVMRPAAGPMGTPTIDAVECVDFCIDDRRYHGTMQVVRSGSIIRSDGVTYVSRE